MTELAQHIGPLLFHPVIKPCISFWRVKQPLGIVARSRGSLNEALPFHRREKRFLATTTLLQHYTGENKTITEAIRDCLGYESRRKYEPRRKKESKMYTPPMGVNEKARISNPNTRTNRTRAKDATYIFSSIFIIKALSFLSLFYMSAWGT